MSKLKMCKDLILEEFRINKFRLDSFRDRVVELLRHLLEQAGISIHQISCRTKNIDSLSKKIDRKESEKKYTSIGDITDIVGIRIITYLESDVNRIAALIESEFTLDNLNSVDKKVMLKADQFGYKSLHSVVSLSIIRSALPEYKTYSELKCEIQIRSILQHAWAEIEHDLGYKGKSAIPEIHKRSFNRLAALLESADVEFDRLKKELTEYENEVSKLIRENPKEVLLDQASLDSFSLSNVVFKEVKQIILHETGATFYENNDYHIMLSRFQFFKIETIEDLDQSIKANKEEFLSFVRLFIHGSIYEELPSNLPLFYYQHFLAAKSESLEYVEKYFEYEYPKIDSSNDAATKFVNIYKQTKIQH